MEAEKRIEVYYAMPLCSKCREEVARIRETSGREKAEARVSFSIWKRIKYGLQLMSMPVVVVNGRSFSVLGAFREGTLAAQIKGE